MVSKLITVLYVSGTTPSYNLQVDSTSDMQAEDHISDKTGSIYRVSTVVDATNLAVEDDVAPDAPEGQPALGIGSAYTPTTNLILSQPPLNAPGWGEMLRRDMRAIDDYTGTIPIVDASLYLTKSTLGKVQISTSSIVNGTIDILFTPITLETGSLIDPAADTLEIAIDVISTIAGQGHIEFNGSPIGTANVVDNTVGNIHRAWFTPDQDTMSLTYGKAGFRINYVGTGKVLLKATATNRDTRAGVVNSMLINFP